MMARRTTTTPAPAPVPASDQARFDAVTRCRGRVDSYKHDGVEPRVLELAVEELVAALAAAPDMPAPVSSIPVNELNAPEEPNESDAAALPAVADEQEI